MTLRENLEQKSRALKNARHHYYSFEDNSACHNSGNRIIVFKGKKNRKGKERYKQMNMYLPEGEYKVLGQDVLNIAGDFVSIEDCIRKGTITEGRCILCDSGHNLIVDLGFIKGIIPRNEGAIGIENGTTRDIALISRVNKPVAFKITELTRDENGKPVALLSRRMAQEECYSSYIAKFATGDIIDAKVTHMEQFGAFVDIGCGISSLIPIDLISVSRISHPSDRFVIGQNIKAVVKTIEHDKITLSHKELLGTWQENADLFSVGETVTGIVRSIENYGIFVELTPNLAGLAELKDNIKVNSRVSVYIKAIIPEKMKVKLIIVDSFNEDIPEKPCSYDYNITSGSLTSWKYSTDSSEKVVMTCF